MGFSLIAVDFVLALVLALALALAVFPTLLRRGCCQGEPRHLRRLGTKTNPISTTSGELTYLRLASPRVIML